MFPRACQLKWVLEGKTFQGEKDGERNFRQREKNLKEMLRLGKNHGASRKNCIPEEIDQVKLGPWRTLARATDEGRQRTESKGIKWKPAQSKVYLGCTLGSECQLPGFTTQGSGSQTLMHV